MVFFNGLNRYRSNVTNVLQGQIYVIFLYYQEYHIMM